MRYAPTLKEVSLFSRLLSCYWERSFALHFFWDRRQNGVSYRDRPTKTKQETRFWPALVNITGSKSHNGQYGSCWFLHVDLIYSNLTLFKSGDIILWPQLISFRIQN